MRALRSAHFWLSIGVLASQHRAASAQPEPLRARESASASKPELADVHARPRALLQNPRDGLLYIALSTQNQVAVIDTKTRQPQLLFRINTGPFPQSLALSASGDVLVVCRYDSAVGVIPQQPQMLTPQQRYRRWPAGPVHGLRDIAVQPRSGLAYVSTPALDGVQAFHEQRGVVQTVRTGLGARVVRVVQDPQHPGEELLLVSNFLEHSVTIYALDAAGHIGALRQRIVTQAAVQDLAVVPLPQPTLLMLTHEDRAVDRQQLFVAGLDSVVLALRASATGRLPFADPGPGERVSLNLSEHQPPLAKLDALAVSPQTGKLALVGAATDNLFLTSLDGLQASVQAPGLPLPAGQVIALDSSPVAVQFLADGRIVTANRLADTVSVIAPDGSVAKVVVGQPSRRSPAEQGELLFFSRALVPHNIAAGERSIYACSACHDDAHVDGRLHPAKRNRFYSMTKTVRGIGSTAPYLFLGEVPTLAAFSQNLVSTHAQGAERGVGYDQYSVRLPLWQGRRFGSQLLSPAQVRSAMTAYLQSVPPEPSPFVPLHAQELPALARTGLQLFKQSCASCHQLVYDSSKGDLVAAAEVEPQLLRRAVALTSSALYAAGPPVLSPAGNNPPSLRGVWENAPYFSDGSAQTLEQVLRRTTLTPGAARVHGIENSWPGSAMSKADRDALLAFLRCL